MHNDIKPQNYLVKFLKGKNDVFSIEIVLTDFGLAGSDQKGGTPIFASPECFGDKTNASDIFSLGRVYMFMTLPKESFLKFLFVPITSSTDKNYLMNTVLNQTDLLCLIKQSLIQIRVPHRIQLGQVRIFFDDLERNSQITIDSFTKTEIDRITTQNLSPEMLHYISDLDHIS